MAGATINVLPLAAIPVFLQHLPHLKHHRQNFERRNRSCSALDVTKKVKQKKPPVLPSTKSKTKDIEPGTLDEKLKQILEPEKSKTPELVVQGKEIRTLPETWKEKEELLPKEVSPLKRPTDEINRDYLNAIENFKDKYEKAGRSVPKEPVFDFQKFHVKNDDKEADESQMVKTAESPSIYFPEYQIAKRYHQDNLKHHPLPDVIDDPIFKALEANKHPNPGIVLDVQPNASAIGWKGYGVPGPTKCSKLKVFRPKTSMKLKARTESPRPKTTGGKPNIKHFTQMDLAICWDLKPQDPSDEPKRSPHIDGSNGSAAPAVFAVVHPEEKEKLPSPKILSNAQAVAEHIPRTIDDDNVGTLPSKIRPYTSPDKNHQYQKRQRGSSLNSISPNAAEYARRHPKTAWTRQDTSEAITEKLEALQERNRSGSVDSKRKESNTESEINSLIMSRRKHYQSSPNLSARNEPCTNGNCNTPPLSANKKQCKNGNCNTPPGEKNIKRACRACDTDSSGSNVKSLKPEYKQAFKAGVPQTINSLNSSQSGSKPVKMPKLRPPYSKRTYAIGTLAPPFSVWPDNHGQDYPEHWRLASVYQHSYKPVDQRRKHLLASVYQ